MEFAVSGSAVSGGAGGSSASSSSSSSSVKLPAINSGVRRPSGSSKPPSQKTAAAAPHAAIDSTALLIGEMAPEDVGRFQMSSSRASSAPAQPAVPPAARAPTGMKRAKVWTVEVENAFRFQLAGFRDQEVWQIFTSPSSMTSFTRAHSGIRGDLRTRGALA